MMSAIPNELTAALPFIFVTEDIHAISPAVMERDQPLAVGSLKKLYWSTHFEELKQEFFTVKAMGPATAEEWLKGLEGRGSERRNDASRWEKWASGNGGLSQMGDILYPGYHPPASSSTRGLPGPSIARTTTNAYIPGLSSTCNSSRAGTPSAASSQRNGTTPDPCRRSSSGNVSHSAGRPPERTKEEVADLKAARRAEIERRARSLNPPLYANILAHIPSFQAALQIITPMDDQGWELLKPRLLAQKAEAEQREKESTARLQKELQDKRNQSAATKEARDAEDADWDDVQAPLRARIAGFADEIIRDGWEDGEKVGRDNCSKFAVEVLTYIRKRFYAEVAKDAAAARVAGKPPIADAPQGPFTQKLTLENMKWIFEVKVKPHTEQYRKEMFLCNGCDVTARYYGFEGVIQHYAAKHTNALSIGNVVVHWRAEWPEHPPFTSEQKSAKTSLYQIQPLPGYNKYQPGPPQPYQPPPAGPTPAYGPPSWSEPYPQESQSLPPAAPSGYAPPGYGANPYPPADPFHSYPPAQAQQQGYNGSAQPSPAPAYNYNYGAYQSNSQVRYPSIQPPPFSHQYGAQLEEMARIARELWNATLNMKDTLSIVRVQVVVYHLAKRFHAKFAIPLPLSTFIDGLSNHKDMRPVRNVNGLICRVCHQGIGGYAASEEDRKSWSLPQLTSHFQSKHVEPFVQMGQYGQPPEWTVDMVLLPEPAAVANLRAFISADGQKYHLVNEAVPHLLTASDTTQTAANGPAGWHDQSDYYQSYQGASAEPSGQFYEQSLPDGPAQNGTTEPYQNAVGTTAQHSHEPAVSYNYTEPPAPAAGAASIPRVGAYAPTEPAAPAQGVALSRDNSNVGRSSQVHRQRLSKKNKKKGGSGRDSSDEEARKRKEEEEKMAEEEAERETDAIKAMWAADRANTAKKSVLPEGDKPGTLGRADKSRNSPNPSTPSSKPGTPQQRNRFQSKPPKNSPRRFERDSPMSAPETRLSQVPPSQKDIAPRGHQLSNVTYMVGDREGPPRTDWRQTTDRFDRDNQPPPVPQRHRSRSPIYVEYGQPPTEQYRQRTPPRRSGEPVYQSRHPVPVEDARYECQQPLRDDYVSRSYSEAGPAPAPAPAPSGDLIEYEIIEYRNPDGTVWVEERPLRRIPNSEAERYYRDAPPPAPAPHGYGEPLPPPPPVSYRRNEPLPPGHANFDRGGPLPPGSYRRDQPPPPAQAGEVYRPPYDRGYSRAPLPPPPVVGPEYYDPRYPSDVGGPRHHELPARPAVPPYYEEEYDPRYPAGPPSMPVPAPPRAARYQ